MKKAAMLKILFRGGFRPLLNKNHQIKNYGGDLKPKFPTVTGRGQKTVFLQQELPSALCLS
ncbi:hypothetical protein CK516_05210 [Nostoc sp. 'Peltigera malacea cyanobiont' DB3992]|nr:hypothetical protein CK516_05210 [Nostoc sp. 'Peltigera malacea cyanobiont' DB3992]